VTQPVPSSALQARVDALEALFDAIARTRMRDVPLLHAGLAVRAVGFEPLDGGALGVLVTPWFMNLVWLPLDPAPDPAPDPARPALAVGASRTRAVGAERFEFIGACEPGFGPFEACSLFSPMFEFADQAAAVATAAQVLAILRAPPAGDAAAGAGAPGPAAAAAPAAPAYSRRALLFGRAAAAPR